MRGLFIALAISLLSANAFASTTIVLDHTIPGMDSKRASTVIDFLHVELSNHPDLKVVERDALTRVLAEHSLAQSVLSDGAEVNRLATLLGANYFVKTSTGRDNDKPYIAIRAIQVATTLTRTRILSVDSETPTASLAQAISAELVGLLGSMDESIAPPPAAPKLPEIPDDLQRPTVMVVIPETHISTRQLVDPAGETELLTLLLEAGFKIVNADTAAISALQKAPGGSQSTAQYAASRGADVLLYGEAMSERSVALGDFVGCRARIELKAIRTRGEEIIMADRAVSGSTDISEAVAAKRAIELAARELGVRFIPELVAKWNKQP